MEFEFIKDLDDYFCEAYAGYDKLCLLPGYVMPKMHELKEDEFGDMVATTLPLSAMRLAAQEKKEDILRAFKEKIVDVDFSFSFIPVPWHKRIKNLFSKKAYHKQLVAILQGKSLTAEEAAKGLTIDSEIWQKIVKGAYLPTKNLIFSLALTANLEYADVKQLLQGIEAGFDYASVRDTVIAYLLFKKITVSGMQKAALDEYRVKNLFIKWEE